MMTIALILAVIGTYLTLASISGASVVSTIVFGLTLLFLIQGILTIWALVYTWSEPKLTYNSRPPKGHKDNERITFSLLLPARHEGRVIGDTIKAMTRIKYPKELYEVLVLVRSDDTETMEAVKKAIREIAAGDVNKVKKFPKVLGFEVDKGVDEEILTGPAAVDNISLVVFDGGPINKPHALNVGLTVAQNAFVGIFDAEDEPHSDILGKVEAVIRRKKSDAVQGGVQLVNVSSNWFTARNCLEYFFWFKSVLPFFSKLGASPLGGNTVFFRSKYLQGLGGWDESALTEDADIGMRFSAAGYKITTMYDEELSTIEEAPVTLSSFMKQRSRWDQGFLQVVLKGEWMRLPTFKQQFLTFYLLIQPMIRIINVLGLLSIPYFTFVAKASMWVTVFSYIPLYFLILTWGFDVVGLYMLKKQYKLNFSPLKYVEVVLFYFPYQIVLAVTSIRALWRMIIGVGAWEKTAHINAHRVAYTTV